ncbi:MAG: DUF4832 domain-containing protein [Myxococcales bacterium]|nr:DUF4832 domain-containing protein [Myxococcales bacterium]MBK7196084.1 DUF4832 domain-containing protein [Myxococcales bacterium]MBP6844038.1 DUF4832 domain-containing protein [Kofleriaceae bacterium]
MRFHTLLATLLTTTALACAGLDQPESAPGPDAGAASADGGPRDDADGGPLPDGGGPLADGADATAATPPIERTFVESSAELVNPERGYYVGYDLRGAGDASGVRANGRTLAITLVRLDAYRDLPLDAALLASLQRGFAAARAAGIKVVLRFTYNSSFAADASRARILGHLAQLTPVLTANADVIAVMQAGFIGAWGEWHTSTNGLDNDADRAAILAAILAALPPTRAVQVRTPMFKAAAYPGGALTDGEAYAGTARARVGHHNDCFLASASDLGTYAAPLATWLSYVDADSRFTPVGGETCQLAAPRTGCASALAELTAKHWSYLNREYQQTVLAGWDAGGCGDEIRRRLGYRFALDRVVLPAAVAPGGELAVTVTLRNRGFAAPFNRRPVELVLSRGGQRLVAPLVGVDARRWAPGGAVTLAVRLRIPATAAAGSYRLALRLPDEAATLAGDPRYAIRLANDGVWDAATGDNALTDALVVDPGAPGPRDLTATTFAELP